MGIVLRVAIVALGSVMGEVVAAGTLGALILSRRTSLGRRCNREKQKQTRTVLEK